MPETAADHDGAAAGLLRRLDLLHDGIEQFGPQQVVGTILHGQNRDVAALFARYQFLGHIVLPFCRIDVTGVDRPFRFEGSLGARLAFCKLCFLAIPSLAAVPTPTYFFK